MAKQAVMKAELKTCINSGSHNSKGENTYDSKEARQEKSHRHLPETASVSVGLVEGGHGYQQKGWASRENYHDVSRVK
jgi:hypothetical protein